MRQIALAAAFIVATASSLTHPALAQTMASAHPGLMVQTADLTTVRDGSDAGPRQSAMPGQADDANNIADLPRIATHAPTRLGLPVPAADTSADSQ